MPFGELISYLLFETVDVIIHNISVIFQNGFVFQLSILLFNLLVHFHENIHSYLNFICSFGGFSHIVALVRTK